MKKKRKLSKKLIAVLAVLFVALLVLNLLPPAKNVENNPFLIESGGLPLIAAHRGGGLNNPESTMMAFRYAVETVGVDILEGDLHLTRDGHLVFGHDHYIDETCDANGDLSPEEVQALCTDSAKRHYIRNMTLEELQAYNFGYYFEDAEGNRPYQHAEDPAALGLRITTAKEVFDAFAEAYPDLLFIIEIKGSGNWGKEGVAALSALLENYPGLEQRIVVSTFHDEVEALLRTEYPHLVRGAATAAAATFVGTSYLGVNYFDKSDFACLQIPAFYKVGPLRFSVTARHMITQAHRRNIAVQYWTVNEASDMRELVRLGCDCIMTDDPALLKEVLGEFD